MASKKNEIIDVGVRDERKGKIVKIGEMFPISRKDSRALRKRIEEDKKLNEIVIASTEDVLSRIVKDELR